MLISFLAALAAVATAEPPSGGDTAEPPDFRRSAARFDDAAGCRAHLARLVEEARASGADAAEGPYDFAYGDVRAHTVRASGAGHVIAEYRCTGADLAARIWTRSMAGAAQAEEEFTVESVARRAPWLKPAGRKQN